MAHSQSQTSFTSEKSNFVLNQIEAKLDRISQRDTLLKTPKRMLYKTHSGLLIKKDDSIPFRTEYSHKFQGHISQVVLPDLIKEDLLEQSIQDVVTETVDVQQESEKPQALTTEQAEQQILDLGNQFPNFSLLRDEEGAIIISRQQIQTNTSYQKQFLPHTNDSVSYFNQHKQPAWTIQEEYISQKNNMKLKTTSQADFQYLAGSPPPSILPINNYQKYGFIGTSSYKNQYPNWGQLHGNDLIKELYSPATLPGVPLSHKTTYMDQFKFLEPHHYQVLKKVNNSHKKTNVSLGSLPFLPKFVQDYRSLSDTRKVKYLKFESPQEKITEIKLTKLVQNDHHKPEQSVHGKDFPKSLVQMRDYLQKTLIKMK